ncbi:DUF2865 domain-containing protein [Youhaiella tibetensis]|uniref:DUF2865 domain-containing protein n=2 Tax=Paradevosia tibetensis TaxID=1447062 RepID=A0A5B9DM10_9HYPH|nr:DUF2865 domain-containing protein [Youhaiella tibetensis]
MQVSMKNAIRLFALFAAMAVGAVLDVTEAYAQANACSQLQRQLSQLERNNDFRLGQSNSEQARIVAGQVQDAESAYVRTGCNAAAKAGQQLTRECQALARTIIKGRQQRDELTNSVNTAAAVSQQRETVLQEMMRFGCNSGSQATVTQQDNTNRGGLFDRLFGGYTNQQGQFTEGDIVGDQYTGMGYGTIRTVCVRKSDGYFWPISYSTLPDYLGQDAYQCQETCPGTPVDLYYYKNPGQEPEQMVNLDGSAYASMPFAFAYRKQVDLTASCNAAPAQGSVSVMGAGGDGQDAQSVVNFADLGFPMPKRDPRRGQQVTTLAPVQMASIASVNVPLPRRRPGTVAPTVTAQPAEAGERIIHFGDKTVRIVGPDTPYAQVTAAAP